MTETNRYNDIQSLLMIEKILKKSDINCKKLGAWCLYPEEVNFIEKAHYAVVGRHVNLEKYPILFWHERDVHADYNAKIVKLLGGTAKVIPKKEALDLLRKNSILDNSIKSFLEGGEIVE